MTKGYSFVLDGIPSELHDMIIMYEGRSGTSIIEGITKSISTTKSASGTRHNLMGISDGNPLEFELSFGACRVLDRHEINSVNNWLFGDKSRYRKLQICQDDLRDVYFNVVIHKSEISSPANAPILFRCIVQCDSQYAYENMKTRTFDLTKGRNIKMQCSSSLEYTSTYVKFTTTAADAKVSIINQSDNNREVAFKELRNLEEIVMDNLYEQEDMISSTGLNVLGNSNYKFLRLCKGENRITVSGNVDKITISYIPYRSVGSC